MMGDPESAQRCAVMVVQGDDQGFRDRRPNSRQIAECSRRARQDDGCADVRTQPLCVDWLSIPRTFMTGVRQRYRMWSRTTTARLLQLTQRQQAESVEYLKSL